MALNSVTSIRFAQCFSNFLKGVHVKQIVQKNVNGQPKRFAHFTYYPEEKKDNTGKLCRLRANISFNVIKIRRCLIMKFYLPLIRCRHQKKSILPLRIYFLKFIFLRALSFKKILNEI